MESCSALIFTLICQAISVTNTHFHFQTFAFTNNTSIWKYIKNEYLIQFHLFKFYYSGYERDNPAYYNGQENTSNDNDDDKPQKIKSKPVQASSNTSKTKKDSETGELIYIIECVCKRILIIYVFC